MPETFDHVPIRFNKVLLTTDFSTVSAKALPYAAEMACHFHSMLYVAHVIPKEAYAHIPARDRESELAQMKQKARKEISALLSGSQLSGLPYEILLEHGDVLPLLSQLAEKHDIDLMVTGTRGKHGLSKLFSGSMAEEIFRLARLPVLAVGPEVITPPQAEEHVARILCVAEFSHESRRAMRYAYALAKAYSARLAFLHVVDDVWKEPISTRLSADAFFRLELMVNRLPECAQGIQTEFLVEFGPKEETILRAAEKLKTQLLVVTVPGTAHPSLSMHLPGPLAYNLVSHARCPVFGVRGKPAAADAKPAESQLASD